MTFTTETEVREHLQMLLDELAYMDAEDRKQAGLEGLDLFQDTSVESFEQAGVLTMNEGLVLNTQSGQQFQLTVVQSR